MLQIYIFKINKYEEIDYMVSLSNYMVNFTTFMDKAVSNIVYKF